MAVNRRRRLDLSTLGFVLLRLGFDGLLDNNTVLAAMLPELVTLPVLFAGLPPNAVTEVFNEVALLSCWGAVSSGSVVFAVVSAAIVGIYTQVRPQGPANQHLSETQ